MPPEIQIEPFIVGSTESAPAQRLANRLIDIANKSGVEIVTVNGKPDVPFSQCPETKAIILGAINAAIPAEEVKPPGTSKTPETVKMQVRAPAFLKAFLDERVIQSIMPDSIGHLVYIACMLARFPDAAEFTNITTGFGGNGEEENSIRVMAYAEPAVILWENIDRVLSNIERHEKRTQPIPRPTIRLFWADQAGIANNQLDEEQTLKNTAVQMTLVQSYLKKRNALALRSSVFETDIPWSSHPESTAVVLKYLASLAITPQSEMAISALNNLRTRGRNHANGNNSTAEYIAVHPVLFGDPLPFITRIFEQPHPAVFEITVGARAEKQFNALRQDIINRATPEDFEAFCLSAGYQSSTKNIVSPPQARAHAMLIGHVGSQHAPYLPVRRPDLDITVTQLAQMPLAEALQQLAETNAEISKNELALLDDKARRVQQATIASNLADIQLMLDHIPEGMAGLQETINQALSNLNQKATC